MYRAIAAIIFTIPLILHPVGALANGPVDPNRSGSVRISVVDWESEPFRLVPHNAVISLYKVATPNLSTSDPLSFDLIDYFTDSGVVITTDMTVKQGQAAASILSSIISGNGIQAVASNSLPGGSVTFRNLSQGAYIVVHEFMGNASQGGVFINPYLLTIPSRGLAGSDWVYDVDSFPKFETAQPTPMPTPIPTTPGPNTTPAPTATPGPTATPIPTGTPGPTATPSPTGPGVTPGTGGNQSGPGGNQSGPGGNQGGVGGNQGGAGGNQGVPIGANNATPSQQLGNLTPTPVVSQPTPSSGEPFYTPISDFGQATPQPGWEMEPAHLLDIQPTPPPFGAPYLPQTGLNRMPVIILSILGFAFILIGVVDLMRKRRKA